MISISTCFNNRNDQKEVRINKSVMRLVHAAAWMRVHGPVLLVKECCVGALFAMYKDIIKEYLKNRIEF